MKKIYKGHSSARSLDHETIIVIHAKTPEKNHKNQ